MRKANDRLSPTDLIDKEVEVEREKETNRNDSEQSDREDSQPAVSEKESPIPNTEDQISSQSTPLNDDVTLSFPQRVCIALFCCTDIDLWSPC